MRIFRAAFKTGINRTKRVPGFSTYSSNAIPFPHKFSTDSKLCNDLRVPIVSS